MFSAAGHMLEPLKHLSGYEYVIAWWERKMLTSQLEIQHLAMFKFMCLATRKRGGQILLPASQPLVVVLEFLFSQLLFTPALSSHPKR